ncbi:MAG: CPBP family intramembrane metalloprotease, partial [Saprospiraceae bacterium]|nr:CPBP family intramembrane metalloprotease [Saprospiraceae bacterium]
PFDLLYSLIVIAVIPAIGEELIFRGHLQQYFSRWLKNKHIGVLLAAFFFSAIHMQFEGFVPRFFLGVILGYIFLWTGSLWLAIWGHFVNNSFQLIGVYFLVQTDKEIDVSQVQLPEVWQTIIFTTLAFLCGYFLLSKGSKNSA